MTRKPATTPPPTDAAAAFETLRQEISLQRAAIQGLTAAKEALPDYSLTLRDIASRLGKVEEQMEGIAEKPAMRLTPRTITLEIHEAVMSFRADDSKTLGEARDTLARTLGHVEGMIKQRRSTDEQNWWLTWAATGGLLCGMFLSLVGVTLWA